MTVKASVAGTPRKRSSRCHQRAVEIYEVHRLDFADAYRVASAERSGVGVLASFDRSIDRVGTVRRDEPA
jgi:predicted nucleic acid-binding protein